MMIPFPAFEVLWNLLDAKVRKVDLIKSQKRCSLIWRLEDKPPSPPREPKLHLRYQRSWYHQLHLWETSRQLGFYWSINFGRNIYRRMRFLRINSPVSSSNCETTSHKALRSCSLRRKGNQLVGYLQNPERGFDCLQHWEQHVEPRAYRPQYRYTGLLHFETWKELGLCSIYFLKKCQELDQLSPPMNKCPKHTSWRQLFLL